MEKNILEEKNELPDGFYLSHLVTKKVQTKHRRLFFELFNNTDHNSTEGVLYLDLRTILGIKVKLLSVEVGDAERRPIEARQRCIFYVDVKKYASRFRIIYWLFETADAQLSGSCKNCGTPPAGKEEDLVEIGKKIERLKQKAV